MRTLRPGRSQRESRKCWPPSTHVRLDCPMTSPSPPSSCPRAACWEDYSSVLQIAAGRMVISNGGSRRTQTLSDATHFVPPACSRRGRPDGGSVPWREKCPTACHAHSPHAHPCPTRAASPPH